jgi:hypothetical protein
MSLPEIGLYAWLAVLLAVVVIYAIAVWKNGDEE